MHQRVRAKLHMHLSPLAPWEFGGGGLHGVGPTPVYGGLAAQVPAQPAREVRHLPEKHDRTVNLVEFLQIYSTSILAIGGNEAVMVNYFPVALTGTARSWLMNLPKGTLHS
jgi:hypothetical protein